MYARTTSLTIPYIRNIIPDDMSIPFWGAWPYRGGAKRSFSTYVKAEIDLRLLVILRSSHRPGPTPYGCPRL